MHAGAVASRLQAARNIRRILAIHPKIPSGQTDLAVLMRIQPGQVGRTRLAATGLGNKGPVEPDSFGRKLIQIRCLGIRIAVAAQFGSVVFGDDQQNVRPRGQCIGGVRTVHRQQNDRKQYSGVFHSHLPIPN